ncbi:MAG: glycosyltransferase [Bacteroidota bacterium]
MKIIHVISGLSTGGAERALYNLLQGGIGEHFDCLVISLVDEGTIGEQIKALGIHVSALGMCNGRPTLSGLIKLRKLINEFQPDVIQGWMYHGNLAASLARALAVGRPALLWNVRHSLYDLRYEKTITQMMIRLNSFFSTGPDVLLYNSQLSKKQHEAFGFFSKHGHVIPNGINVKKFSFSSKSRKKIRTELKIPENALVVGHVARLHPMKDHSLFLRAAIEIINQGLNVHYILSGRGVSIENTDLVQYIPSKLRNRFHLLGERTDVPELMSAMDIFCQSSWSEAFPNVIGEAMATGLPCVATDVGDTKIIIGDTGLTVSARNEKELISGLVGFLKLSQHDRLTFGKNARARIENNFILSAIVEKYSSLYEQLIIEKR